MASPFETPDFTKLMSEWRLPGVDMQALMASQRRNFEALTQANQLAFEGLQAVLRRQTETVRSMMEEMSTLATHATTQGAPHDKVAQQTELVKTAFEKTLANLREMAEMVAKSNTEAADVLSRRVSESLTELRDAVGKGK